MPWKYTNANCGRLSVRTVSAMRYAANHVSIKADATVSAVASLRGMALVNLLNRSQKKKTCLCPP